MTRPVPYHSTASPSAGWGLLSIASGTLLALVLIPQEYGQTGSLHWPAVAQTIGLLVPVGLNAFRRPKNLFRSENVLTFGVVYWIELDMLQGINEPVGVTRVAITWAFAGVGLFAAGVWLAVTFRPMALPRMLRTTSESQLSGNKVFVATAACFALAMANYLIACDFDLDVIVRALLSRSRWDAPWASARMGGWSAFREHLAYFGYLVPTLTVLTAVRCGWLSALTLAGVAMSGVIILFASQGGTRGEVGVIVNAALITWLLTRPRLGASELIRAVVVVGLTLAWMQLMLAYRNEGWLSVASGYTQSFQEVKLDKIQVDDNFNRLCQVVDLMPERQNFVYGQQLWYVMVRPIPRAVWADKPDGPGFSFEDHVIGSNNATTLSVTIIGELYFDFGMPFVLIGGFALGRLAAMWNQLLDLPAGGMWPVLYGLGAMALFVAVRSEQAFIVRTYPVIFWLVLDWLTSSNRRANASRPPA